MSAISCILGEEISSPLYEMLSSLKHRGPDLSGVYVDGTVTYGHMDDLDIPEGRFGIGHNLLSIDRSSVIQPLKSGNIILACNGNIYNHKTLRDELQQTFNYCFKTDGDSEVLLALITLYYDGDLSQSIQDVLKRLDGEYAFVAFDGQDLVAVRDPVGVKPLYYGSNDEFSALASERKALWAVGINQTHSLPPRYMLLNHELVPLKKSSTLDSQLSSRGFNKEREELRSILKKAIVDSVKKRVGTLERVGIPFSGGLDSTLLAVLCKDLGVKAELYAVGSEGSQDVKFVQKVSDDMGLPLHTRRIDDNMVRECIPPVLNAIEEWNLMKLGVGITVYLAAAMAHENGLRVILSGQGADELFAGYHRYLDLFMKKGEKVQDDIRGDVDNLYHVNLERDDKVAMASSVELRVPYLDMQVINIAMNTAIKYKINGINDQLRKCILREVAIDVGVPREIAVRPKKAAQYGSGVHKILKKKILRDEEYMEELKNSYNFIDI